MLGLRRKRRNDDREEAWSEKAKLSMFFNYLDVLKDERKERERNRYSSHCLVVSEKERWGLNIVGHLKKNNSTLYPVLD